MLLQVYKYFFCNKNRRRSLLLRHFDDSNGEESLNVLNTICIFKNFILVLWKSLNHPKVYVKKSVNSWECIKVCSVESGLKHRGHLSSEANLYFISSFLVGIILCITLKENCPSLLSFEDLCIAPIRKFWKMFLPRRYCRGFSIKSFNKLFIIIFNKI